MVFVGVCVCPEVLKEVRLGQHDLGEVEGKHVEGQVVKQSCVGYQWKDCK